MFVMPIYSLTECLVRHRGHNEGATLELSFERLSKATYFSLCRTQSAMDECRKGTWHSLHLREATVDVYGLTGRAALSEGQTVASIIDALVI